MNKFYYLLVLIIVLAIALISRWLLTTVEAPTSTVGPEVRHDPDYYLENFKLTLYQPNGEPAYYLTADFMNHFPDDDTMAFKKLQIEYHGEDKQDWITTANEATAYQNIEVMHLSGDVQIHRQTQQPEQAITITTDSLRINFPKKHASTTAEVKIVGKNSSINAKGMDADLLAGRLVLMSDARGHYVPK
jgi:lipopolysaccharide export system protein LptC